MTAAYGLTGRIGLGVPQANPTVEAEFAILLPRTCTTLVTRLTSTDSAPAGRLRAYLANLDAALDAYDTLRPDIFGFACTGSSYLLGHAEEARIVAAAEARYGYPIVTATAALHWALSRLGARRIALVAPYPVDLVEAAATYWREAGFDFAAVERVETGVADTRGIYALGGQEALAAVAAAQRQDVDAVVMSGTGMPSLATIATSAEGSVPVLSSNLALAGAMLDQLSPQSLAPDAVAPPAWRGRLAEATYSV